MFQYVIVCATCLQSTAFQDPYVRQAQIEGYRCRSAYKLIEIDQKYNLLKKGLVVVRRNAHTEI